MCLYDYVVPLLFSEPPASLFILLMIRYHLEWHQRDHYPREKERRERGGERNRNRESGRGESARVVEGEREREKRERNRNRQNGRERRKRKRGRVVGERKSEKERGG